MAPIYHKDRIRHGADRSTVVGCLSYRLITAVLKKPLAAFGPPRWPPPGRPIAEADSFCPRQPCLFLLFALTFGSAHRFFVSLSFVDALNSSGSVARIQSPHRRISSITFPSLSVTAKPNIASRSSQSHFSIISLHSPIICPVVCQPLHNGAALRSTNCLNYSLNDEANGTA